MEYKRVVVLKPTLRMVVSLKVCSLHHHYFITTTFSSSSSSLLHHHHHYYIFIVIIITSSSSSLSHHQVCSLMVEQMGFVKKFIQMVISLMASFKMMLWPDMGSTGGLTVFIWQSQYLINMIITSLSLKDQRI